MQLPPNPSPYVPVMADMLRMTEIKAGRLPPSTLPHVPLASLCIDFVNGFCRRGEKCSKSHEICVVPNETVPAPSLNAQNNFLSLDPRAIPPNKRLFDDDGPGTLSKLGPRHDNDHVEIKDISILPTTDEILCRRLPYMPRKDPYTAHRHYCGEERLLDTHFRHLRYENTEPIVDACYHASQRLSRLVSEPKVLDYDDRMVTARGFRYSLFRDVAFEEIAFNTQKGVSVRVSFACPKGLRGSRLETTKHLEEGMLVALIGLDEKDALSTIFMEIWQRQSTNAMRPRTGNDLRASVILTFAEPSNVDVVRRILYNAQGLLEERFILVELPNTLYAGFYWTLKQLQKQSQNEQRLAFLPLIAPWVPGESPEVSPPEYASADGFAYQLDVLRQQDCAGGKDLLALRPNDVLADKQVRDRCIESLCSETTLDRGQAIALCDTLCRGLAFTQGPPGTGKTYLGVALAKVLLASAVPKPILVVCMTNHALDSYLEDLRKSGVKKLARLGSQSKEQWTKEYKLSVISRNVKRTTFERSSLSQCYNQIECLTTEGTSWCGSLNTQALSWPAVRELLNYRSPTVLDQFAGLEKISESTLSDIRLARKAGGFAFEFWCAGGDIKDIDRLLEKVNSMLGERGGAQSSDSEEDRDFQPRQRVFNNIVSNADAVAELNFTTGVDVWRLSLSERQALLTEWNEDINPLTISDRTAEIHRRHHTAICKRNELYHSIDARCLEQQDVIGMTTTACAMNWSTLSHIGLKVVICEEAAEVMEAQSLCSLFPTVEHAISIGDPEQLRPQVNEMALSVETETGASYRLDESLMERMMLPSTAGTKPIASSRLSIQRRMHPEIADIMRATLYPYLEDHESTLSHTTVPVMADRVWWLDHQMPEDVQDPRSSMAKSSSNAFEVAMIAGLVEHLVNSNEYEYKDITILTPYNGQLAAFTERFSGTCSLWLSEKDRESLIDDGLLDADEAHTGGKTYLQMSSMLKLATIDNFQGEESKVVILSLVRSNLDGLVGFLKTSNRINVGCSRARDGFYIIGNATQMRGVKMWDQIINNLTGRGKIGPYLRTCCPRHPSQIDSVQFPEQWHRLPKCQALCEAELPCGHICSMECHAPALHDRIGCDKPCTKTHAGCGHPCFKTCGENCGDCEFPLGSLTLPCGHEAVQTCSASQNAEPVQCDAALESIQLRCGHWQEVQCSKKDEPRKCREKCGHVLNCGHNCGGNCQTCSTRAHHMHCDSICSKELLCGHRCAAPCHEGQCPPCDLPCQKSCQHGSCSQPCSSVCDPCVRLSDWACTHTSASTTMCCLPCAQLPCNEPCTELLPCGHLCPSLCSERCPTVCSQCLTGQFPSKTQMFLPCGHQFDLHTLDDCLDITKLYQVDGTGRIAKVNLAPVEQLAVMNLACPSCGQDCKDLRRYALSHQLLVLEGNIDRMCAKLDRKLNNILHLMYKTKAELDKSFGAFAKALRPGPLTGRTNQDLVIGRGNAMVEVQSSILGFRDYVVRPFEDNIIGLASFLGDPVGADEIDMTLPYLLHFDALFYRCRLIVLEEGSRMQAALNNIRDSSQHTSIMAETLKAMTIMEANDHLATIGTAIGACEAKGLKRLETELRLVQICFHIVLRDAGTRSELDVSASLTSIHNLCQMFPKTAGLLSNTHVAVKAVVDGRQRCGRMYTESSVKVWWTWPKHVTGKLKYCKLGHPYSGETWEDCPECGEEVPRPQAVNPESFLKEKDFVAAMRAMTTNTKQWRV